MWSGVAQWVRNRHITGKRLGKASAEQDVSRAECGGRNGDLKVRRPTGLLSEEVKEVPKAVMAFVSATSLATKGMVSEMSIG